MSTRAHIAYLAHKGKECDLYRCVYVHGDGYPGHTGRVLFDQARELVRSSGIEAALSVLVEMHPTGYSGLGRTITENECYCHARGEGLDTLSNVAWADVAVFDYTYLLDPLAMRVYRGRERIGRIEWDVGKEPVWATM